MTVRTPRLRSVKRLTELYAFNRQPDQVPAEFQGPYQPPAAIIRQAQQEWLNAQPVTDWWRRLMQPGGGKMFGILVVRVPAGLRYLVAFSGKLQSRWCLPGFVPPMFDPVIAANSLSRVECQLQDIADTIVELESDPEYRQAVSARDHGILDANTKIEQRRLLLRQRKADRAQQRKHMSTEQDLAALDQQSREDKSGLKRLRQQQAALVADLESRVRPWDEQLAELRTQRTTISAEAQLRHFDHYQVHDSRGETRQLVSLFEDRIPPGGAGDCAAPKLLQFAYKHRMQPVALAEFWLGGGSVGQLRHHRQFYPPCRSRCAGLLRFMLPQGSGTEPDAPYQHTATTTPEPQSSTNVKPSISVVFEDEYLLIVNKPAGVLSVKGKSDMPSVVDLLIRAQPNLRTGCLAPAHRLDMDTSGLLIVARDANTYRLMQQRFEGRQIKKRYVALLERRIACSNGQIELPLRVDLDDRPRQQVCFTHGKPAVTRFEVIDRESSRTRIAFFPVTGRTHQLRVHAAHPQGLHAAILGDPLYARPHTTRTGVAQRLHLHASDLAFDHPVSGIRINLSADVPF